MEGLFGSIINFYIKCFKFSFWLAAWPFLLPFKVFNNDVERSVWLCYLAAFVAFVGIMARKLTEEDSEWNILGMCFVTYAIYVMLMVLLKALFTKHYKLVLKIVVSLATSFALGEILPHYINQIIG
ncbi:MAG: hypothetical protein K6D59_05890 [Bacteroidales bacterium]|nr:hypothetical protein [Bacteroidales bacterium]